MHTTHTLHFAGQIATVQSPNSELSQKIQTHFAHCLSPKKDVSTNACVDFSFKQTNDQWQLYEDDRLILTTHSAEQLLPLFMEQLLIRLITPVDDHLIFHAAGVQFNQKGVILCGDSGVGKSTLTSTLIHQGFAYLSDEIVAVPLSLDSMVGFPRSLVLKADSKKVWEELLTAEDTRSAVYSSSQGSFWVPPTALSTAPVNIATTPQLLIFPRFQPESHFTPQPISAGKAAFNLLEQLANARNLPRHGIKLVARFAKSKQAFEVTYSQTAMVADWLKKSLAAHD
ncbi:MAG: hypothetical protein ACI9EW_003970 [Cellvibrionaceae bacterium]|jgi:hypothetical protein